MTSSKSASDTNAYGRTKLITEPIGGDKAPTAVAMALSLSPNHVEAILLGRFIKKGWPNAANVAPTKYGVKLLPE